MLVVTTVYIVATISFSGLLRPGLVLIGLLSSLSTVVTLLIIIVMASNKVQSVAMVRALGMLIMGLPCLPWFINSG